ncbi:MAG: ABC transporter ATP-binding protein [Bacteroidales bacterium]|jgi:iron complex transport system ATP-binding protein|nr:ABC transporter ATP-binding protein [Bacteroidales bacterium]
MSLLTTTDLSIGYIHRKEKNTVQTGLQLEVRRGEMVCLIGPNGCGKSTLLRTLAGLQPPLGGQVKISGQTIQKVSAAERAQLISLVLTDRVEIENATVRSIVAMGRHPYSNWWGTLSEAEVAKVDDAIRMVHLQKKAGQLFAELSDGEKQRVMIAKAFVQDTPVIMLDEPTAHLDLPNRVEIMLLLHRLAHRSGKAILLSTHELDMALQAADRIWLMTEKGIEVGVPEDLVLQGSFSDAFLSSNFFFNPANGNFSMNYHLDKEIELVGEKTRLYWTLRALARAGYAVVEKADRCIVIENGCWRIGEDTFQTIEELLQSIH